MTNTERFLAGRGKIIGSIIAGAVIGYLIVTVVLSERLSDLELHTKLLITEQQVLLATIAEATSRNGADEITEEIVRDCSVAERVEFDTLLGQLNTGLNQAELVTLERLFGRCGNFFAQRKSVMVARLQREIEIYETFVRQLDNITNKDNADEYQLSLWSELAELEQRQSELFSKLVLVQDEIITLVLAGNTPTSDPIVTTLQEANEIQGNLILTNNQAAEVRSALVSL